MKYFRISYEDILWKYSWKTILLLSLSIPKYKDKSSPSGEADDNEIGEVVEI